MDQEPMDDSGEFIINETDGLPNIKPSYPGQYDCDEMHRCSTEGSPMKLDDSEDSVFDGLPKSLIVTNLNRSVFDNQEELDTIETVFREFDEEVTFQYFKSFRRIRVNYTTSEAAAKARIRVHQSRVEDTVINCYFAQPVSPANSDDKHLQPPAPYKQYLISPPASPPVGWEPVLEAQPLVNCDLLAAIANLAPGEKHELHPPKDNQPAIIVQLCEADSEAAKSGMRIPQTRCPERT